MPNWTNNNITIKGEKTILEKLIADAKKNAEGKYCFSSWFPMPETYHKYDTTNYPNGSRLVVGDNMSNGEKVTQELIDAYKQATKEQKEKYGVVGWYEWNCANYGCKWDEEFESLEFNGEDTIEIDVTTPWSAPIKFLMKLSVRYGGIEIKCLSHYEDCENKVYYISDDCCNEDDCIDEVTEISQYIRERFGCDELKDFTEEDKNKYLCRFLCGNYYNCAFDAEYNFGEFLWYVDEWNEDGEGDEEDDE